MRGGRRQKFRGKPQTMAALAPRYPCFYPQPGRIRKRNFGVRHCAQCFRRGHVGRSSAFAGIIDPGFFGNSQRAACCRGQLSQRHTLFARQGDAHASRARLQPAWTQVFPSPHSFAHFVKIPTETRFCRVKTFSLRSCGMPLNLALASEALPVRGNLK